LVVIMLRFRSEKAVVGDETGLALDARLRETVPVEARGELLTELVAGALPMADVALRSSFSKVVAGDLSKCRSHVVGNEAVGNIGGVRSDGSKWVLYGEVRLDGLPKGSGRCGRVGVRLEGSNGKILSENSVDWLDEEVSKVFREHFVWY
jgi:hypothetical protein